MHKLYFRVFFNASHVTPLSISLNARSFCRRTEAQLGLTLPEIVACHHAHMVGPDQCCSVIVQPINAPVETVWLMVRSFDNPKAYKHFVESCPVVIGDDISVGMLREVHVVSRLPDVSSTERLETLDDEQHVLSFSVVSGDHHLQNYRSVTTLHAVEIGTLVIESHVVDVF